jgi:gp30
MIEAKVIADSVSQAGARITTLQLKYPRFIHSEFLTHRAFSRNSSSSRAIPVSKMIEQVRNDPAMPVHWGLNQAGMQAESEVSDKEAAESAWRNSAMLAADCAATLNGLGLHKQVVNRVLEPFQYMHTVITATEWDNFFELRRHKDAQPEIQALAEAIYNAIQSSSPKQSDYHLPYIEDGRFESLAYEIKTSNINDTPLSKAEHDAYKHLAKLSAARCARVSYLKHDGTNPSEGDDLKLFERLVGSRPLHASPTEHQAVALRQANKACRNFYGWEQFRVFVESSLR